MRDGKVIGISTWCGYSANEGKMLTPTMLDKVHSDPGTEVTFVWGEEAGGVVEGYGRAPHADRNLRDRQPCALFRSCPHFVGGRLAYSREVNSEEVNCGKK